MSDDIMTIRQMCDAFDVTPRTLRFYEAKELLSPRRQGQRRLFTRRDRARLKLILRGRKFGFALEDIRQWLLIYEREGTDAQMRSWIALADRQLGELAEQRRQIDEAMAELKQLRDETAASLD